MTVDEMLQGGVAAARAGDMAQAAQLFARAVQADPQSERGWLGLGLCQTVPEKQTYCFRRVLAINPNNAIARKKLAAVSAPDTAPRSLPVEAPPRPIEPAKSKSVTAPTPVESSTLGQSQPSRASKSNKTRLVGLTSVVVVLVLCGVTAAYLYASGRSLSLISSVVALVRSPTPSPTNTFTPSPTVTPTVTTTPTPAISPSPTLNYRPYFVIESCPFIVPTGASVDCGFVVVPEDRTKDPKHTIRLAVAVYHGPAGETVGVDYRSAGKVAPEPVIFLHGGPGDSALKWSSQIYSTVVLPIVRERDLVLFDQRGAGLSIPSLNCPELTKAYTQDLQSVIASDKRESLYTDALVGCHDRLVNSGVDPAAYSTLASAADVKDILIALGYRQKANLYGISYGTRLAQMVMREYPEIVRSVVIDSVLPLEVKLYNQGSATSDYALRTLFQGCAADPACQSAYPDLETVYADLVKQLDNKPITVPVSLPLDGPAMLNLSMTYETTVTGLSLTNDLLWLLQHSELIPSVPQALYHIRNGDYSLLRYAATLPPKTLGEISMGVYLSINCHEQVYATTPDELGSDIAKYPSTEAIATAHVYGSGDALFHICGLWQAKPLAEGENAPVVSDIPTLIVAGAYDPTTPPSFGQQVGSHLSHSYLFEFPDQGHGPTAGAAPCPMQVVIAFFTDPSVEPDRTCLNETKPVRFLTPYTGAPPLELTAYEDKKFGVAGLIPATWKDIGYGFFSRSASPLDQTQIGQQTDTSAIADWLKWLSKEFNARRGFDKTLVQTGERRANQFVWKLYHTTSEGLPVDLAFARSGSRTLLVIMQSYPDEHTAMYKTVFLPLVDAATLGTATPLPTTIAPATPPSNSLSPINAGNVDQIQSLFTHHVKWDTRADDLLVISPDKKWVALTPKDGTPLNLLRLKWAPDGSFVPMIDGWSRFFLYKPTSLAFSPDATHFAVANGADHSVLVFDLVGDLPNDAKKTVLSIGDRPEAVTFTKDSQKLIIGTQSGADGSLQLWDLATASLEREISMNTPGGICSAAISPDGKILAARSCAKPFDISTWKVDNSYTPLSQPAGLAPVGPCTDPCPDQRNIFAFNPLTGQIASSADFPRISIQDPRTGKISATVTTQPVGDLLNGGDSVSALTFTSDGAILVMAANQELQLIDAKNGNLLWHHEDPKRITAVAISADSKLLISVNADGDMVFWGVPAR